eukprot:g31952.t1
MSLFAASLDKLKKRTTELLDGLDKDGKDGASGQEASVEIPFDPQVATALGCPDDSILVRYEVQNAEDKDRELALYSMPLSGAVSVTVAMVRSTFPPPGHYHFRFKAPTSDGSFGGWVWIDLASDQDYVPVYNGGIAVKALCLPSVCASSSAQRPAGPASAHRATGSQRSAPGADLMELDMGKAAPTASASAASAPAASPPPKAKPLDRAQLVAERQARERREYEEKMKRHEEQKAREEKSKKEKSELNDVLAKEMNEWARTPDGQSYKEIRTVLQYVACGRTLLSTMHTVMWEGTGWKPLSLSELVADSSIKKNYRKAILLAHPDRHQSASSEQQVRADRIFNALNESFKAHKLKRMIQSPNSFFMDVKCPGCLQITTVSTSGSLIQCLSLTSHIASQVFSHAQTVVLCGNCNQMLCQPTGGLARLTEGCSFRRKAD